MQQHRQNALRRFELIGNAAHGSHGLLVASAQPEIMIYLQPLRKGLWRKSWR
jgi:hypothetical protein